MSSEASRKEPTTFDEWIERHNETATHYDKVFPTKDAKGRYTNAATRVLAKCWQARDALVQEEIARARRASLEEVDQQINSRLDLMSRLSGTDYESGVEKGYGFALEIVHRLITREESEP